MGADPARARGRGAGGGGPDQPGDRRPPGDRRADGQDARLQCLVEAGREQPARGGRAARRERGRKSMLTTKRNDFIILPSFATGDSMKRSDAHDWKTTSEVAAMLRVTPQTVINLINRGRFPGAYKI